MNNDINDIKLTHPKLYACVHHSIELAVWAAMGALAGGAYGYLFKAEPILTAKLAAIQCVAYYIFEEVNKAMIGGPEKERKKFYLIQLIGEAVIGTIALIAYQHFNIIGNLGTGVMALFMLVNASDNLDKSNSTPEDIERKEELDQIEEKKGEPEQQELPKDEQPIEIYKI